MKYGIEQQGFLLKCSNCQNIVSKNGDLQKNFCEECGAPLSVTAIADYEQQKEETKKLLLNTMKDIAIKNNTDSFTKIIKIMIEEY